MSRAFLFYKELATFEKNKIFFPVILFLRALFFLANLFFTP